MKKFLSLVLCMFLLMGLVACGSSAASSSPTSSDLLHPSSQPEPEPDPIFQAYLTGLEKDENYPENQRICAVMVNNIAESRPTRGLSEAQIVYEIRVEGGITRFMAVYQDYKTMPEVGSVRSARDQFLQLLIPSWGFYVHDGPNQNQPTNWMLRDYDYGEFDLQPNYEGGLTWRDQARKNAGFNSEYTEYTDGEHIAKEIEKQNRDAERTYNSPIFSFVPYNEPTRVLEEGNAPEIGVIHSQSYRTLFKFNDATGRYEMSQYSSYKNTVLPTIDENNDNQVAFDNVLVLFAPMSYYANSPLVKVNYANIGIGYYFNGGKYETIRWAKGAPDAPLRFFVNDTTETTLQLNPGTSYVAVVDDVELENFYNNVVKGTTGNASDGQAATSEVDTVD